MATINASMPIKPGATVKLNAAIGPFAENTQGYLVFYQPTAAGAATLNAIVRVPDDVWGTFDLLVAANAITAV